MWKRADSAPPPSVLHHPVTQYEKMQVSGFSVSDEAHVCRHPSYDRGEPVGGRGLDRPKLQSLELINVHF